MSLEGRAKDAAAAAVWALISTLDIRDAIGRRIAQLPVSGGRAAGIATGSGVASQFIVHSADGQVVYGPAPASALSLNTATIAAGASISIRLEVKAR